MVADKPEPSPSTADDSPGDPDQQRIGIIHLLVWTACVAVYLGLRRAMGQMGNDPSQPFGGTYSAIVTAFRSIGYGAALGGLVLWAARRRRGLAFPKHPGEYLLVALGLGVALHCLLRFLLLPITSTPGPLFRAVTVGHFLLASFVWLWLLLAVKSRRWRTFFGTLLASHALFAVHFGATLLLAAGPRIFDYAFLLGWVVLIMAADVILVVIVLMDHRQGNRYPWAHWLGVAVKLWIALIEVGPLVGGGIELLQIVL